MTQTPLSQNSAEIAATLAQHVPFSFLSPDSLNAIVPDITRISADKDAVVVNQGDPIRHVFFVQSGSIEMISEEGEIVAIRGPGDLVGVQGLFTDEIAPATGRVEAPAILLTIPAQICRDLHRDEPGFAAWFQRSLPKAPDEADDGTTGLTALRVADLMTRGPITCDVGAKVADVARLMREHRITSVLVTDAGALSGIITARDLTNRVLAEGLSGDAAVRDVMTPDPVTISSNDLGLDAVMKLSERRITHLPVVDDGNLTGMIGQSDLFRYQASTASHAVAEIAEADTAQDMRKVVDKVPELLAQLVGSGARPGAVCRRITDITDAITRRLLMLAEEKFGAPPVPYLWLACGSQGRQEQTGVSDQDNCLILDDAFDVEAHDAYFAELAKFVSDGLDVCGFFYCPGDMMATNPRWRQPRKVWEGYFDGWIAKPDGEAQMLASVMFDLRPIGGDTSLFDKLQQETLANAQSNSIFVAHMISNSLKHAPPLSLLRGISLIRSGEHKNTLDLKHSGVVPIVDLGRVYALKGRIEAASTRTRLEEARKRGVISEGGGRDLIDAFELIAEIRLKHQAEQIRNGEKPDNFMAPVKLSELERNHLRNAFQVVKTMQAAAGQAGSILN